MIRRVHHIGIVVRDMDEAIEFHRGAFDVTAERVASPPGSVLEFALLRLPGCEIELMAEAAAETPLSRFLQSRGPGIHHLAFEVQDIEAAMSEASSRGLEGLSDGPLAGIENTLTCFFHPRTTLGVLYEYVQPDRQP